MPSTATLLALHRDARVLTLPNAWDPESALMIEALGAQAIATTSAVIAHLRGFDDGRGMPADVAIAAIALMEAALAGAAAEGVDVVLNARTDVYLKDGIDPSRRFDEVVARGKAYLASGAACFFVPVLKDADTVAALVRELGWHTVSLLGTADGPHPQTWAAIGVARVSYGPYVHRARADDRAEWITRLLADA